jgi:bifunctional DNA-binding transcriptional regulator/antitoxin component of YhaV-PrlF toxin-antitoxin module
VTIDEEAVMPTAKLSTRLRISVPTAVRTARGWRAGQVFAFIPKADGVLLVPVPTLEDLAGVARGADPNDYRERIDRGL